MAKSATCMLMSGPLLTGYTQTINDYFDKDIDAINEPNRPIPSGAPSGAGGGMLQAAWQAMLDATSAVTRTAERAARAEAWQATLM